VSRPTFSAFRSLFGAKPLANQSGQPLRRQDNARRQACLAEAKAVLGHLPNPGECIHLLMTGRYDLMHLLLAVFHARPEPIDHLRIATLSFNKKNLAELLELLDSGKVKRFSFVFSKFFREHTPDTYQQTAAALSQRGQRFASPRSHAKVACCHWQSGDKLVMEGSANLRSNGNQEQLTLFTDPALHDWHAAWIDDILTKHETEEAKSKYQGQGTRTG
jgi:hypothetical protein